MKEIRTYLSKHIDTPFLLKDIYKLFDLNQTDFTEINRMLVEHNKLVLTRLNEKLSKKHKPSSLVSRTSVVIDSDSAPTTLRTLKIEEAIISYANMVIDSSDLKNDLFMMVDSLKNPSKTYSMILLYLYQVMKEMNSYPEFVMEIKSKIEAIKLHVKLSNISLLPSTDKLSIYPVQFDHNLSGEVNALNDVKTISEEYYGSVITLLNSIINGSYINQQAVLYHNEPTNVKTISIDKCHIVFTIVNGNCLVHGMLVNDDNLEASDYYQELISRIKKYQLNKLSQVKPNLQVDELQELIIFLEKNKRLVL